MTEQVKPAVAAFEYIQADGRRLACRQIAVVRLLGVAPDRGAGAEDEVTVAGFLSSISDGSANGGIALSLAPERLPSPDDASRRESVRAGSGTSWRSTLTGWRSRRWSRLLSDWVGAQTVWLRLRPVQRSLVRPTSVTETVRGRRHFRNRSIGLVERSTQRPDEVVAPDWRSLRVILNDRAAIFAEDFPAAVTAVGAEMDELFTHDEAQGLLFTFAGAWPVLGQHGDDSSTRFVYLSMGQLVCRFRGVELAPGAIVIDDIASL